MYIYILLQIFYSYFRRHRHTATLNTQYTHYFACLLAPFHFILSLFITPSFESLSVSFFNGFPFYNQSPSQTQLLRFFFIFFFVLSCSSMFLLHVLFFFTWITLLTSPTTTMSSYTLFLFLASFSFILSSLTLSFANTDPSDGIHFSSFLYTYPFFFAVMITLCLCLCFIDLIGVWWKSFDFALWVVL